MFVDLELMWWEGGVVPFTVRTECPWFIVCRWKNQSFYDLSFYLGSKLVFMCLAAWNSSVCFTGTFYEEHST